MKRILVVGEDALCCALGERLVVTGLPGWQLARPSIDTKGVTKLVSALNARRGAQCSPSLTRALKRVQALDTIQG